MCGVCTMRDFAVSRWRPNLLTVVFVALATMALPGDRVEAAEFGGCIVTAAMANGPAAENGRS